MKKVINSLFGYRDPKPDEDFTDVIYTKDEYNHNSQKISDLERTIKSLGKDYDRRVEVYKQSANDKIAEIRAQANERVAEVQIEMNAHKIKADSYENVNRNLIRVAIERANAQRGLTPKKQHIGYIFLSIDEYLYNCECQSATKSNRTVTLKLPCFRIWLQSPYQVSFALDSAKTLIYDDFLGKLAEKIGVQSFYGDGFGDYDENEVRQIWNSHENFMFKMAYRANFQRGFWEIDCLSRHMVGVPTDMSATK